MQRCPVKNAQLDLDASFTTDKLEVQLSAGLQGKVTNALDWIGNIAGALAQADNTTLAIMIRQARAVFRPRESCRFVSCERCITV